jgi:hypothetical protein
MTGMRIRQCPRCELRFPSSSELEDHLAQGHRPRQTTAVPHATARVASPAQTPPLHDPDGRPRVGRRASLLASSPAAALGAAAPAMALNAAYVWRAWARAEQRRARRPR